MSRFVDGVLRVLLTGAHQVMKAGWFVLRPESYGAHALAFTPDNKIILVKLRYAPGWRIPGGGRAKDEPAVDAALRELREEIGMTGHGEAALAGEFSEAVAFKRDMASLVVVRDVRYRPRWTLEVESVREAELHDLPDELVASSKRWIETVTALL